MAGDILLADLADGLQPVRPRAVWRELAIVFALGGAEVLLLFWAGAARPDLIAAMATPVFWWRAAGLALIAAVGLTVAVTSLAPDRAVGRGLRWLAAASAAVLASGIGLELAHPTRTAIMERIDWPHGVHCAGMLILLSLPIAGLLAMLMRRGAPTDRGATALSAGVGAGAAGAFVFTFACPASDPLYILLWYAAGCGVVTMLARSALPRLMQW